MAEIFINIRVIRRLDHVRMGEWNSEKNPKYSFLDFFQNSTCNLSDFLYNYICINRQGRFNIFILKGAFE